MKTTYILLTFFFLYNCTFSQKKNTNQNIEELNTSEQHILNDLRAITNTIVPRNYKNTSALNKVASYISNEFQKVCDTTFFQEYKVGKNTYKNVIASLGTSNTTRIVIGAHYDVCGDSDGADDNASGVAGLLELIRLLAKQSLKYRIDFVAYTLEEPPFFRTNKMGSYIHAKNLFDNNIPVKGMICLESIGYFNDSPNSQSYPVEAMKYKYGTKGNFITVVQENNAQDFSNTITELMKAKKDIKTISFKGSKHVEGVDFSDHLNYWKFDYDAIMITNTAFFRNKNYHQKSDKIETLDISKLNLVVQQLYHAILEYNK